MLVSSLLLGSILAIPQAPLRVLVTHTAPDEKALELLKQPSSTFRSKAEESGYVLEVTPLAIFARPANLYNIAYVEQCMEGWAAVARMLKGDRFMRLGDLSSRERDGMRMILADKSLMADYGPLLSSDGTMVHIDSVRTFTITDGRKEIPIQIPGMAQRPPEGFVQNPPSSEETAEFRKSPKYRKDKYADALVFSFGPNELPASFRAQAIEEFSKMIFETLDAQHRASVKLRSAIDSLALGEESLPSSGQAWQTLSEANQRAIESTFKNRFKELGFDSEAAATGYLAHARLKNATVSIQVGIGVKGKGGTPVLSYTTIDVKRN